jgi:hypothetical protein
MTTDYTDYTDKGSSRKSVSSVKSVVTNRHGMRKKELEQKAWFYLCLSVFICGLTPRAPARPDTAPAPTFNRDVAPLLFDHCANCHHKGQAAPFTLLTYEDAKKHARDIARVTEDRYMPPWLPAPGYGDFGHNRSLATNQISLLARWYKAGTPEGDAKDLPKAPTFADGWQLGTPDLVVTAPQAFNVPAEGKDIYRNLVFPIPMNASRFVKGVEFNPGNAKVVHHAFINIDETRKSRRLAERQNPPGFDGMDIPPPAHMPAGQFLGWQPGRVPGFAPPGLSWLLRTNTDTVLQLHLHPTGKPETVQPSIAFYFTDDPPTNSAFRIAIKSFQLDIPAGESNYVTEESYRLPVPTRVLRVETHAHYLCKQMQGWVILPGGEKNWLIWIKDWDFNWQGGYDYAEPLDLPAGSEVFMHYTYDNSANNPRNPNNPPKRVRFGLQTTDEMGELWLQAVAPDPSQLSILGQDYVRYISRKTSEFDEFRLRLDPNDVGAHVRLGHNMLVTGKRAEAETHIKKALELEPNNAQAHHEMALVYLVANQLPEAERELRSATRLDPYDSEGLGNLGYICAKTGRFQEARQILEQALKVNPDDTTAARLLSQLPAR